MSNLVLYHGSRRVVSKPQIELCRPNNDYGRGFYCTESAELAKEWACQEGHDGFANKYSIETAELQLVDLNSPQFNILNWLAVLLDNRLINAMSPTMAAASQWLKEGFSVDLANADIVKGYRADDSYFGFARAFLRNEISLEQLSKAMHLGKLGEQYMIKSPAAFEAMKHLESLPADSNVYWPLRGKRDIEARTGFSQMIANAATAGKAKAGNQNAAHQGETRTALDSDAAAFTNQGNAEAVATHRQVYIVDLMRMRKEEAHALLQQNLSA